MKQIKKWREWEDLQHGANKTLKYQGRTYSKNIPDDQEKLMTAMVNWLKYHKKEKEHKELTKNAAELMNNAASVLVNMGGSGGKESNIEEIMGHDAEDDDNCKQSAERMKNSAIVLENMG